MSFLKVITYIYRFIYYSSIISEIVSYSFYSKFILDRTESRFNIESNIVFQSLIYFFSILAVLYRDFYKKQLFIHPINFGLLLSKIVIGNIIWSEINGINADIQTDYYNLLFKLLLVSFIINSISILLVLVTCFKKTVLYRAISQSELTDTSDNIDESWECSICSSSEEYSGIVKLSRCNHIYHRECITKWANNKNNCPLCRTDISLEEKGYSQVQGDDIDSGEVQVTIL